MVSVKETLCHWLAEDCNTFVSPVSSVVPSPVKPASQSQVKLPVVLVQVALASQSSVLAVHSSTSEQEVPLPVKPELHEQVKPPVVLVQVALASQSSVLAVHSLMSVQPLSPSPEYPEGHAPHVGSAPTLLVQVVRLSQPPLFVAHSLISVQPVSPSPE